MAHIRSNPLDPTHEDSFPPSTWVTIGGPSPDPIKLAQLHAADSLPENTRPMQFYYRPPKSVSSLLGVPLRIVSVNLPFVLAYVPSPFNLDTILTSISLDTRVLCLFPIHDSYVKAFYEASAAALTYRGDLVLRTHAKDQPSASSIGESLLIKQPSFEPIPRSFEDPLFPESDNDDNEDND